MEWNMKPFDFDTYRVPGKSDNTFICLKRGKVIQATSEEYVRQAIINYLLNALNIKKGDIEVELAMRKLDAQSNRRADITVHERSTVLMLIECKAPEVALTDDIYQDQALDYARSAQHPEIIWITNGHDHHYYAYDVPMEQYRRLAVLPDIRSPKEMKLVYYTTQHREWQSPTYKQIWDAAFTDEFAWRNDFEHSTFWYHPAFAPPEARAANIRIGEWLFFTPNLPSGTQLGGLTIVEDRGVFFKTVPVPGFRYRVHVRSMVVKNTSGEQLVWDNALIFLNQKKEAHLASRLSEKGSGSFAIQAGLDTHIHWNDDLHKFYFTHHPKRLTMGKNNLGLKNADFIRSIAPQLLQSDGSFRSPWLDVRKSPTEQPEQYLHFFGFWADYVSAIKEMKTKNKALKTPAESVEKKPQILGDAKKLANQNKHEEAIRYLLDHLHLITESRKKNALMWAFDLAENHSKTDLSVEISKRAKPGSDEQIWFLSTIEGMKGDWKAALEIAEKHPDKNEFHIYWAAKYWMEIYQKKPNYEEALKYIALASQFKNKYSYNLNLADQLIAAGEVRKGLGIFDTIPLTNLFTNYDIETALQIIIDYGPLNKIEVLVNSCKIEDEGIPHVDNFFYYWWRTIHDARKGDLKAARKYAHMMLELWPDDPLAKDNLVIIDWQEGKVAQAFQYFSNNCENMPSYTLYAWCLAKDLHKTIEAEKLHVQLTNLLKEDNKLHDPHYHAANILFAFFNKDQPGVQAAARSAQEKLVRTEGLEELLKHLVSLLKVDEAAFYKMARF
jgi:hypothetical protein